jgi:predicted Zn finger-like uncharacterized protein
MPEVVTCPKCERQLRVPDELIGQRVKCPTCGTNFTATVAGSPSGPSPVPSDPSPGEREDLERGPQSFSPQARQEMGDDYGTERRTQDKRQRALSSLKVPGIFLITLGVLAAFMDMYLVVNAIAVANIKVEDVVAQNPNLKGQEQMVANMLKIMGGTVGVAIALVLLFASVMMIIGGICMLVGRARWLAILGSVLALVNISCCCVLAMPFGIWSLVLLLTEDVKNAFQ